MKGCGKSSIFKSNGSVHIFRKYLANVKLQSQEKQSPDNRILYFSFFPLFTWFQ